MAPFRRATPSTAAIGVDFSVVSLMPVARRLRSACVESALTLFQLALGGRSPVLSFGQRQAGEDLSHAGPHRHWRDRQRTRGSLSSTSILMMLSFVPAETRVR
jgi:hypothetical protein